MFGYEVLLLINFSTGLYMLGLVALVQAIHYPAFHYIDEKKFLDFHKSHLKKTTYVVAPVMVLELLSALFLFLYWSEFKWMIVGVNLLTIGTWLSTFVLSVPAHNKLIAKKDDLVIAHLVRGNIPRLLLWIVKSLILFIYFM